ncbi:hypothetical protein DD238_001579 [Peronospora effusa]|uniref:RRM domain-containing protein n=1 Tax=Peronospora effusa TaxID=542832 RepID=A0A3M6VNI6_9STRA|nr:hypothetical protein DD238_001579 [Peronospora effusa]RQM12460.1 hypothetical protein DD237_004759 [Peronospora effusa]
MKRGHEVNDGHEQSKRLRRSRWGDTDDEKDTSTSTSQTSASPKALSDIVKRLSSVVKEKTTPEELQIAATRPLIGASGQLDAQAARARALAQASLLSLNLPGTNVSPNDLARRLYIGNLYYDLKEEDIRNAFAPFGYDDVLAAESAVQVLNGTPLANRTMRVGRPHRGNTNPNDSLSIGQEAIKKHVLLLFVFAEEMLSADLGFGFLRGTVYRPTVRACVMAAISPVEPGLHREYGFMEFVEESCALSAIQHMNGFELAGQPLKVGKASEAAMLLNLATSQDKVVRDGSGVTVDGANGVAEPEKKTIFAEDDVEGVRDVADGDSKCCLCLVNLVNCGEVDDEVEDEVRGECGKFGIVKKVVIHELVDHVRVFVVFENAAGALKAKQALHGRFFGGNQVQVHKYSLHELEQQRYTSGFL